MNEISFSIHSKEFCFSFTQEMNEDDVVLLEHLIWIYYKNSFTIKKTIFGHW